MSEFEFTDRYGGGPGPDLATMCKGQCEGMGRVPHHRDDPEEPWRTLWAIDHRRSHRFWHNVGLLFRYREFWFWRATLRDMLRGLPCDGWHFVQCPDCGGSGKRQR